MQARRKQREEEMMDRKADKAQEHAEQLRRDREQVLNRIQGYHSYIDRCAEEMSEYIIDYIGYDQVSAYDLS